MIPARLNSRRIPRKNLAPFCGGSLLEIAVTKAIDSKLFDKVYVNSPDEEILQISADLGAIPYRRSQELDEPEVTNADFVRDFFSNVDCLDMYMVNTTSPLLSQETIRSFIEFTEMSGYDTVMSVRVEQAPILFNGRPCNFSFDRHTPSEQLTPYQKIVWAITYWDKKTFMANRCGTYAGKIGLFDVPKLEALDLDTREDWRIAEEVYRSLYGRFTRWTGFFPELGGE